ncbi:hypothetical protein AMECASPLE_023758 [Ameca splendens]|uniref:Uncharacterized protein n=1 Tax=Ameca splendens TaxID=208324 RepID=A0ABV0XTE7_9TELE
MLKNLVLTPCFLGPGQGPCPWRSQGGDGEGGSKGVRRDQLRNHSCFGPSSPPFSSLFCSRLALRKGYFSVCVY